jgi:hypothetical protein
VWAAAVMAQRAKRGCAAPLCCAPRAAMVPFREASRRAKAAALVGPCLRWMGSVCHLLGTCASHVSFHLVCLGSPLGLNSTSREVTSPLPASCMGSTPRLGTDKRTRGCQ